MAENNVGNSFLRSVCAGRLSCDHPLCNDGRSSYSAPLIFSHRGALGKPYTDSPIVTQWTLRELARHGVNAADLDLFWTRDGTLFVGHAMAVQAHLLMESVFDVSAGVLERRAPGILRGARLLQLLTRGGLNLTVALDLKGESRPEYARMLTHLCTQIRANYLESRVWLWVASAPIASVCQARHEG